MIYLLVTIVWYTIAIFFEEEVDKFGKGRSTHKMIWRSAWDFSNLYRIFSKNLFISQNVFSIHIVQYHINAILWV